MTSVAVHGLGYVGLPNAALFANEGFSVIGIDTDRERIETLREGAPGYNEVELEAYVQQALDSGRLSVQMTPAESDYHLICVPTPLDADAEQAVLTHVEQAARNIEPYLREGDTVILTSTSPPGTTENIVGPALEMGGLRAGLDFHLAYCPETILPGAILQEIKHNDRIVGGTDDASTESTAWLFESVTESQVHRAPDPTTAEFVKLTQNTFRDTNIALANELAKVARDYNVDVRSSFELANTHPRVSLLNPGPGVGGHCLPVDPYYLGQDSDAVNLIECAREVNDRMVDYVYEMLTAELGSLDGTNLAIFGLAYKGNVDDARNSPGKRLAKTLLEEPPLITTDGGDQSLDIRVYDPYVTTSEFKHADYESALNDADVVVITTDHDRFTDLSPTDFRNRMRGDLVIDTKWVLDADEWAEHGIDVEQL
ncbi:nucleotide sugar dehydrogenase [Haloarcula marismortui]|uniref:UDP-N-acetyl-D-mannosamine dehydrogenase n=1 Tax=Haloarcula marismortui ATCC 33800 TaxID=662476 RepID=M0JK92_9EURY|nr:nucleotide sugar dehydrogenase [Haloarcula sinaiiensis]EMA08768.1 nucleotide sugar dehydrogenase [Haloarcula sinaiiensis ATCC 33800]QUJ74037.1 nucleotide sugar dehydrogenase [Haloarcula sinaiiensis ATCC 33800]